jgi:membrane protein implicated in regulation of membrane protease activity
MSENMWLIILGVVLMVLELVLGVATGFDLLIIGIILVVSGVVGNVINSFSAALILVAVLAVVYVFFGRTRIKSKLSIATTKTNSDALLGKEGIVVKKITAAAPGQVKVDGEIWRAAATSVIDEGESVVVESVSGVTVTVKKI